MRLLLKISILASILLLCSCKAKKDPYDGWVFVEQVKVCTSRLPDFGGYMLEGVKLGPNLVTTTTYSLYTKLDGTKQLYGLLSAFDGPDKLFVLRRIPDASDSYNPTDGYWGYNYEGINEKGATVYVSIKRN